MARVLMCMCTCVCVPFINLPFPWFVEFVLRWPFWFHFLSEKELKWFLDWHKNMFTSLKRPFLLSKEGCVCVCVILALCHTRGT